MATACATCASRFDSPLDPLSEKPLLPGRDLDCCGRSICSRCLNQNKRYETYCPYCQITTEPSLLPQGLKDPPAYSPLDSRSRTAPVSGLHDEALPAYSEHQPVKPPTEKHNHNDVSEDVLHFLTPNDTMSALSLAYGVPINALRKTNNVYADHLLQGRKTLLIPGEFYKGGVSLSPQPVESEEEELKKNKIRRWQVACKVAEYDVAVLYLKNADWDLEDAIAAFREDEQWEKDHPLEAKQQVKKGKSASNVGMRRFLGSSSNAR
ncbi:Putative LysM and putative peptidoglycan-binding domain-containing protein 1-4 [Septoria linicola]|uniref:LysM and putative peptidoglycan-binding domain-containing protein 1-4 n=1 Tax=Septoria linicola TaxID=215465 RepID=A0A9Q9AHL3_9PEZI|nr:Putative LysM and putative peptidoglycan-binding domain-containing protein 1-4 [Septoria linicola]